MKKNDDKFMIAMDRDMYYELLGLASIGAAECGDRDAFERVDRHVRKFNTHVKWQHLKNVEQAFKINKANRAKTIELLNLAPEYLFRQFRYDGQLHYERVKFIGRSLPHKQHIRVRSLKVEPGYFKGRVIIEHVSSLVTEIPEGWMEITHGDRKGYFMPVVPTPTLDLDFAAADAALGLSTPNS